METPVIRRLGAFAADVYRCFDAEGRLLYVGCSVNAYRRLGQHRRAVWFPELARFTVTRYKTLRIARAIEAAAIIAENPIHNVLRTAYIPDEDQRAAARATVLEFDDFELAQVGRY